MKYLLLTVLSFLTVTRVWAQGDEIVNLSMEARLDYTQEYLEDGKTNDLSGFKGKYLNLRIDGNITEGLSYSYRQRLNKPNKEVSFFDATDWIHITYTRKNWSASAGKQIVGLGGYEYDASPVDLYFCSEFWSSVPCFKIGISGTYTTDSGKDRFMLQFCESPFRTNAANVHNGEMFSYNAVWYGFHGFYDSIWSVNMIEYLPGKFINYIALGNKFTFGDLSIYLDVINRAISTRDFFGKDMSIISEFKWSPLQNLNIFAKYSLDFNHTDEQGDWAITPGTNITRIGGGIEYFPLKNSKNLRLHLNYCYTDGINTAASGLLKPKQNIIDAGITWKMNILKLKR